jgi:hypothetical protein
VAMLPPTSVPPVPADAQGAPVPVPDAAMGRFNGGAPNPAAMSPDAEARRAYAEAQASGADPVRAAKDAWKGSLQQMATRFSAPNFRPADPGEGNLQKIAQLLQSSKGLDPITALGLAHEYMAEQQAPAGTPPPGGM